MFVPDERDLPLGLMFDIHVLHKATGKVRRGK